VALLLLRMLLLLLLLVQPWQLGTLLLQLQLQPGSSWQVPACHAARAAMLALGAEAVQPPEALLLM
jgi:hypothetical protein